MATLAPTPHPFDAARRAGRAPFKVQDLTLADFGRREIRLAEHEMPGLMALRAEYRAEQPLACPGGSGPTLLLDDGGDATLLVHKGAEFEQEERVPDHNPVSESEE